MLACPITRTRPVAPRTLARYFVLSCLAISLAGCPDTPDRIDAPSWDPEGMADTAMSSLDTNSDGQLSQDELAASAGINACWHRFDENGDGQISREELVNRIQLYVDSMVGLSSFNAEVRLDGSPLEGADVRLVPEPFLSSAIEEASGKTGGGGYVSLQVPGEEVPGARIGMYRVVVTGPGVAQKYQSADTTDAGVEVSPQTEDDMTGMPLIDLYSR